MRACIARVFSDIASTPVPSLRSRIWRTTGHFESHANILSISLHFGAADNPGLKKMKWHLHRLGTPAVRILNPRAAKPWHRRSSQARAPEKHGPAFPDGAAFAIRV